MKPIGLKIPLIKGKNGYFEQTFDSKERLLTNLKLLLLTIRGERPFEPDYGTNLYKILFDNIEDGVEIIIEQDIRDAVSLWFKEIQIETIEIDIQKDINSIFISLSVTDLNDGDTLFLEFSLPFNTQDVQ